MELKLGSIPLRVRASFFLMALLLGFSEQDPVRLVTWVAVVLVSVMVHELGHALMGKAFGLTPQIELHGMGGLTVFNGGRFQLSTGKSIAISLAGPFAGFLFAALILAVELGMRHSERPLVGHTVALLLFVNVYWGAFNLLPMLPLDGGNVLRTGLTALSDKHGEKIARVVSVMVALAIGVVAVRGRQWWMLYLGALFGFQNVQALRQADQLRVDQTLVTAIENGYAALDRKAPAEAIAALKPALESSTTQELRQIGLRIYLAALLREGRFAEVMDVVEREHRVIGAEDLSRLAETMSELGHAESAARIEVLAKAPSPLSQFRS
ncbi:MAG TPA: M50 family metallopeptidase [Labilithrix sp.]|jgi:Zn-dependent protease|nr:M50 family metallopeptidase [Labilithrix sp.]